MRNLIVMVSDHCLSSILRPKPYISNIQRTGISVHHMGKEHKHQDDIKYITSGQPRVRVEYMQKSLSNENKSQQKHHIRTVCNKPLGAQTGLTRTQPLSQILLQFINIFKLFCLHGGLLTYHCIIMGNIWIKNQYWNESKDVNLTAKPTLKHWSKRNPHVNPDEPDQRQSAWHQLT